MAEYGGDKQMAQSWRAPGFITGDVRTLLFSRFPIEWSCPACGVSGTVEASDDVDSSLEAIKAHHTLVSPDCPNSRHVLDVVA